MSIIIRSSIRRRCSEYLKEVNGAKSDKVAVEVLRDYKRWLCRNDLFYLLAVSGMDKIAADKGVYQPFCDEVSLICWKVVQSGVHSAPEGMLRVDEVVSSPDELVTQRLYLCYRAFYKTTIITIGNSAQLLLNFNNIHIVLCHNKQNTSGQNLVAIKNLFLNRPVLAESTLRMIEEEYGVSNPTAVRDLFPECIPDGKEWGSTEKFSLNNRTDWQRPESSVEAKGVDTEITGGHWQVAKKNDLVTEKSVNTEEQIAKTDDWDNRFNIGHFDDRKFSIQDYEGTRYHHNDLYSKKKKNKHIKLIEIPIVQNLKKFNFGDDSQITHPSRYNRADINMMMDGDTEDNNIWVFMCQMMLKPEDPAKKRFELSMIHEYDLLPENLITYLLVDPANEKKKKSDWTAMTVVGVSLTHYYILDMVRDKLGPDERIDAAVDLIKRWNIKDVGWEKVGLTTDTFYLKKRRDEECLNFSIKEIVADNRSKVDRIRDILVPQYAKGRWLWPKKGRIVRYSKFQKKDVDLAVELRAEFLQFPNGTHDDMLDTQSFFVQMNPFKPSEPEPKKPDKLTFGDYVKMKEERLLKENKDPWSKLLVSPRV